MTELGEEVPSTSWVPGGGPIAAKTKGHMEFASESAYFFFVGRNFFSIDATIT